MEKGNGLWFVLLALLFVVGLSIGFTWHGALTPNTVTETIEVPGETVYINVTGETITEQVNVSTPSEDFWVSTAWNQITKELDGDSDFLTCGEYEFDADELSTDLESASISWDEDGNYEISLDYQFKWEDGSDERDCKVDKSFTVSWDDNDVDDKDWNEASVEMIV